MPKLSADRLLLITVDVAIVFPETSSRFELFAPVELSSKTAAYTPVSFNFVTISSTNTDSSKGIVIPSDSPSTVITS